MTVVNKITCYDDLVLLPGIRPRTVDGQIYSKLVGYLRDKNFIKPRITSMENYRKIGRYDRMECPAIEVIYLYALIEYMILLNNEFACDKIGDVDGIFEEYDIACIKNTLRCKFGKAEVIEDFINCLGLRAPLTGISYMAIDDDTCQVFTVHPLN